jgi:hypothetical protein
MEAIFSKSEEYFEETSETCRIFPLRNDITLVALNLVLFHL